MEYHSSQRPKEGGGIQEAKLAGETEDHEEVGCTWMQDKLGSQRDHIWIICSIWRVEMREARTLQTPELGSQP